MFCCGLQCLTFQLTVRLSKALGLAGKCRMVCNLPTRHCACESLCHEVLRAVALDKQDHRSTERRSARSTRGLQVLRNRTMLSGGHLQRIVRRGSTEKIFDRHPPSRHGRLSVSNVTPSVNDWIVRIGGKVFLHHIFPKQINIPDH